MTNLRDEEILKSDRATLKSLRHTYILDWSLLALGLAEVTVESGNSLIVISVTWDYNAEMSALYVPYWVKIDLYSEDGTLLHCQHKQGDRAVSWWGAALFCAERYTLVDYLKAKNIEEISDIRGKAISWKNPFPKTPEGY